jgi:surfactin synthase thioesterase subunit
LFESVFNYTHFYPLKQLRQGAAFTLLDVRAWAETEFVIRAEFSRHFFTDQVGLYLQYHANVFDAERMIEIGDCYLRALQAMVTDPAALRPVSSDTEVSDRLVGSDPTGTVAVGVGSIGSGSISLASISGSLMDGTGPVGATHRSDQVEAEWSAARERIAAAWSRVLGIDAEQITDQDDFFALGGHSLAALRAVMQLNGLISLGDLTLHSRLGALTTAAVTKPTGSRKLLRTLTLPPDSSRGAVRGHLVCVPYAAGSALGYRPLARELAALDPSIVVHAVELPGHEAGVDEEFEGVRETATRLAEELLELPAGPIVLWSHCGGASVAVHTAGLLEAAGADLRHLLIAAKLLPTEEEMTGAIAELGRSTNTDVIRWMVEESGYTELTATEVAAPEVISAPEPIGTSLARAFRHDVVGGHRYFLDVCARPQEYALSVPVSFVAATDDPLMGDYRQTHHRWRLVADDLRLIEIDGGGHYFARTRAADCAALVARVFTSLEGNQ